MLKDLNHLLQHQQRLLVYNCGDLINWSEAKRRQLPKRWECLDYLKLTFCRAFMNQLRLEDEILHEALQLHPN